MIGTRCTPGQRALAPGDEFDVVLGELVDLERAIAAAEGRRARLLARAVELAEVMNGVADGGAAEVARASVAPTREAARRSLVAEVACATRRSEGTVARWVNEAECLVHDLPMFLHEVETGAVSYAHARRAVTHVLSLPPEARSSFEARLVPLAHEHTAARFDDRARRLREEAHPESIIDRSRRARDGRGVWFEPEPDGMATLHHHLPAVDAVAIDDLIDRVARSLRADDDPRTHAQRRSDALADIVLGGRDGARRITPTIIVTVPAATIANVSREPAALHGYGPIDADTARAIAATAPTFLRALVHPDTGDTISVLRRRYRPTGDLRTALIVADETCRFPGCGRRASRCELDHTRDWALGGDTSPANLAHLCSRHHHLKHDHSWRVEVAPEAGSPAELQGDEFGRRPPDHLLTTAETMPNSRSLLFTSPRGNRYVTHAPRFGVPPRPLAPDNPAPPAPF
ncbi:DUF222 domain-containing protein [Herbiconiux sp. KACC 21604]|uniref:HNH endonuclease signature motif containing protein n=1 Tax=unclassified Herbiconiux TaxID=2618217 RepID=UPI001492FAC3|nr:HNH endonuclease signature motif containing protein [Herbiconiux sp. SALV-R1]QJU52299.1 DUF222 domain-containing protein [Herbiconiux sp. SALV-R1]WPO87147.1 DUF222 domain-containing protein [Herbiconiux sp. KACC 21604]